MDVVLSMTCVSLSCVLTCMLYLSLSGDVVGFTANRALTITLSSLNRFKTFQVPMLKYSLASGGYRSSCEDCFCGESPSCPSQFHFFAFII